MTRQPFTDRLRHMAETVADSLGFADIFYNRMKSRPNSNDQESTRVAIACQGGGSHAAFTAGMLARLLPDLPDSYTVTGFSGTSGGAVCVTAAWYGSVSDAHEPDELLEAIWTDIAASDFVDQWVNEWLVASRQLRNAGSGVPAVSPYDVLASNGGCRRLRDTLTEHIDFEDFASLKETTNSRTSPSSGGTPASITSSPSTLNRSATR